MMTLPIHVHFAAEGLIEAVRVSLEELPYAGFHPHVLQVPIERLEFRRDVTSRQGASLLSILTGIVCQYRMPVAAKFS